MNTSDILTSIGSAATSVGSRLSGKPALAVVGVGVALTLVGDLLSLGMNPTPPLEKVRDLHPDLQRIRAEREALRQAKVTTKGGSPRS